MAKLKIEMSEIQRQEEEFNKKERELKEKEKVSETIQQWTPAASYIVFYFRKLRGTSTPFAKKENLKQ